MNSLVLTQQELQQTLTFSHKVRIAPPWFIKNLNQDHKVQKIKTQGLLSNCIVWKSKKKNMPFLVFLHGNSANSHWFSFLAPFFLDNYNILTIDLMGMGDSDWAEKYSRELFIHQINDCIKAICDGSNIILLSHSFGGFLGVYLALTINLKGLVLLDYLIRPPEYYRQSMNKFKKKLIIPKKRTYYKIKEDIKNRFRFLPQQPCKNEYMIEFLAEKAIKKVYLSADIDHELKGQQVWTWKYDHNVTHYFPEIYGEGLQSYEVFPKINCPISVIYGRRSMLANEETLTFMRSLKKKKVRYHSLDDAHHHLMCDEPLALTKLLKEEIARF